MKRLLFFLLIISVFLFGCESSPKIEDAIEEEVIDESGPLEEVIEEEISAENTVIVVSAEFCQNLLGKTKEEVFEFFSGETSRYTRSDGSMEEISYFEDKIEIILEEGKVSFLLLYPGVEFLGFLLTEETTIDEVFSYFGEPSYTDFYSDGKYYHYDNFLVDVVFFSIGEKVVFIDVF
jgi:hypothetical protein